MAPKQSAEDASKMLKQAMKAVMKHDPTGATIYRTATTVVYPQKRYQPSGTHISSHKRHMSTGTFTSINSADALREEHYESGLEDLDEGDEMAASAQANNPQANSNDKVVLDDDEPVLKRARLTASSTGKDTPTLSESTATDIISEKPTDALQL